MAASLVKQVYSELPVALTENEKKHKLSELLTCSAEKKKYDAKVEAISEVIKEKTADERKEKSEYADLSKECGNRIAALADNLMTGTENRRVPVIEAMHENYPGMVLVIRTDVEGGELVTRREGTADEIAAWHAAQKQISMIGAPSETEQLVEKFAARPAIVESKVDAAPAAVNE